jgi:GTP-binding protein
VVRDATSGEILGDLVENGQEMVVAKGGRGGRGNTRFATSTNRVPRTAENGAAGEELELDLELKLLADVGLVGLPNAGKSTLLARLSAARPKVADYPFTTLEPHLGVVNPSGDDLRTLVMADIPGIIEGAHEGAGLGIQFLRHVERCPVLVHLVDLASDSSLGERVDTIRGELEAHTAPLEDRPWILVGTKIDAMADREAGFAELATTAKANGVQWTAISAVTGEGIDRLVGTLFDLVEEAKEEP